MKIKANIPGFGEKYCSNNVEYQLYDNGKYYLFYKKETDILHNEYGKTHEWKDGSYVYYINDKLHRLNDCAYYDPYTNCKTYDVIEVELGKTKKEFIENLANVLIPKDELDIW